MNKISAKDVKQTLRQVAEPERIAVLSTDVGININNFVSLNKI